MKLLIKNGNVVDIEKNFVHHVDILIEDHKIKKIAEKIRLNKNEDTEIIDAEGLYVMPGFVDMHAHFMDPGDTDSEDIESGSLAAAAGGFTTVCAMPNTKPVTDCLDNINYVKFKAMDLSSINIIPVSSMTLAQNGEKMVDFDELYRNGVRIFSDVSKSVQSALLMNEILDKAEKLGVLICDYCEDSFISRNGVINASETANKLGLTGIPNIAEDSMLARNLYIAHFNKARYHVCHCSTAGSVELISTYKALMKDKLSAEVSITNLFFCDEDIIEDNADFKVKPPIRSKKDRAALLKGLKDGVIDAIVSNHSPHLFSYKQLGFKNAPFGIIGFQTAFSLAVMSLIDTKILSIPELAAKLSYNPAKIIGIDKGLIKEGETADLAIADIKKSYILTPDMIKSKSMNTPLLNKKLKGKIKYTIVNGKIIHKDME